MAKISKTLALLALALGACGEGASIQPAPLDRFSYPTGLALHTLGDGTRALVVVSSNFDLRYDPADGGSVLVVDPVASSGDTLAVRAAQRIPSFAGPVAIVSGRAAPGEEPTCREWTTAGAPRIDQVLVASRRSKALFRIDLADDGALSCGERCPVPFASDLVDPYAVAVACFTNGGVPSARAYVTHLGTTTGEGFLSQVDLLSEEPSASRLGLSAAPTQDLAWDAARRRLFVTTRFFTVGFAPLRWLDFAFPAEANGVADLNLSLRGTDARGIALAAPAPGSQFATRAYVAARVYNQDIARTFGGRTPDVGGALIALDLSDDAAGRAAARVTRIVPVGIGPSNVLVLPGRPTGQEIVAVTSAEGSVSLYDATTQSVVRVLDTASADTVAAPAANPADPTAVPPSFQPLPVEDPAAAPGPRDGAAYRAGERLFGTQPFALAADTTGDGRIRLFVSSFDRGFVAEVAIDPAFPAAAQVTKRFGRRHP